VKKLPLTSGLAQAGVWLARNFVRIFNICARANGSEPPPSPSRHHVIGKFGGQRREIDKKIK
jgi:hypothetical protein